MLFYSAIALKIVDSSDPIRVAICKSRNNSKGLNCYLMGVRMELLAKRTD
jgi:hypothetical protein